MLAHSSKNSREILAAENGRFVGFVGDLPWKEANSDRFH